MDDENDIDDTDDTEDLDEGEEWYDRVIKHVQTTPPRCLSGFQATPVKEEWDDGITWKIACSCGSKKGKLLGYPLYEEGENFDEQAYISPLSFECSSCAKVTPLLDTKVHGYNSEISEPGTSSDSNVRGTGTPSAAPCASCGEIEFMFKLSFMHAHFDLIEDEPELEPRAQDFFDGFNCDGKCTACGEAASLANFELA